MDNSKHPLSHVPKKLTDTFFINDMLRVKISPFPKKNNKYLFRTLHSIGYVGAYNLATDHPTGMLGNRMETRLGINEFISYVLLFDLIFIFVYSLFLVTYCDGERTTQWELLVKLVSRCSDISKTTHQFK